MDGHGDLYELFRSDCSVHLFRSKLYECLTPETLSGNSALFSCIRLCIKCLKVSRQRSHPERLIGRSQSAAEVSIADEEISKTIVLLRWIYDSRAVVFIHYTHVNALSFFQLSLLVDILKQVSRSPTSTESFPTFIHFAYDYLLMNMPSICGYSSNLLKIIDAVDIIYQIQDTTCIAVDLLDSFYSAVNSLHPIGLLFDWPCSAQYEGCALVESIALRYNVGPAFFSMLCNLLLRNAEITLNLISNLSPAKVDSAGVKQDFINEAPLRGDSFENVKTGSTRVVVMLDSILSARGALGLVRSLCGTDKELIRTLLAVEECRVVCGLTNHKASESGNTRLIDTANTLSNDFERVFSMDRFANSLCMFFFFVAEAICFDPCTFVDFLTNSETEGLRYFVRILRLVESNPLLFHVACQRCEVAYSEDDLSSRKDTYHTEKTRLSCTRSSCGKHCVVWLEEELLLHRNGQAAIDIRTMGCKALAVDPEEWGQAESSLSQQSSTRNSIETIDVIYLEDKMVNFMNSLHWELRALCDQGLIPFKIDSLLRKLKAVCAKIEKK